MTRQALKEVGFVGVDAEMVKLHLRLRPREGDGAIEGCWPLMFVGQVEHCAARGRDQRPECDTRCSPGRKPDAAAKTEDRIEHGAGRVGERPAVDHRDRRADPASATQETRAIGLELRAADHLAFDDRDMRCPELAFGRRSSPPCSQNSAAVGDELGLYEQIGEGRMSGISRIAAPTPPPHTRSARSPARAVPRLVIETRRTSASSSGDTAISILVSIEPSRLTISARSSKNAAS